MRRVLMVCMGNICRSQMAQAVATQSARECQAEQKLQFDSAGTSGGNVGEPIDPRAKAALLRRGYEPPINRSRRIAKADFERFDLILAMDQRNLSEMKRICPADLQHKLRLLLDFAEARQASEIPDPYYGSLDGFERVLDLCEAGAQGLVKALARADYAA